MADGLNNPGVSQADLSAAIAKSGVSYVGNSSANPLTFQQLLIQFPPGADMQGRYARITDLYGAVDDIMRCRFDGLQYRWVPQREAYVGATSVTTGTIAIIPMVTPPTLRLTASSLTGNVAITPLPDNAYVGQRARVIMPPSLSLGVYAAAITGLTGVNIPLVAGTTKDIEFGGSGWFQSS